MNKNKLMRELIEKYRYADVEDPGWAEHLVGSHIEALEKQGFSVRPEDVQWDMGFSQGSGASYTVDDWDIWKAVPNLKTEYPMIATYVDAGGELSLVTSRASFSYCHARTISITLENEQYFEELIDHSNPIVQMCWENWEREFNAQLTSLEAELRETLRDEMDGLHSELEEEYLYLTSDKQVEAYVREWVIPNLEEEQAA